MDNTTATTAHPDTFKRSLKKVHNEITAAGWSLQSADTYSYATKAVWTLDDPEAYTEVTENARGYQAKRIPTRCEASFDPETGAYYGINITDAEGHYIRHDDTVTDAISQMTYPSRQLASLKRDAERAAEQAIKSANREASREAYLANLDDYRMRSLQRTAEQEPTFDAGDEQRPSQLLSKVQAHAERHAKWIIANQALNRIGWPTEDGGNIDIATAVNSAATEMLGSWDYRDMEKQLMEACRDMMRDYRS